MVDPTSKSPDTFSCSFSITKSLKPTHHPINACARLHVKEAIATHDVPLLSNDVRAFRVPFFSRRARKPLFWVAANCLAIARRMASDPKKASTQRKEEDTARGTRRIGGESNWRGTQVSFPASLQFGRPRENPVMPFAKPTANVLPARGSDASRHSAKRCLPLDSRSRQQPRHGGRLLA